MSDHIVARLLTKLLWVLALVAIGALATSPAGAAKPASPEAVDEARKRMEKGQALFAQGRYKEAMLEFEQAYKMQPYGAFLYNAALAAEKAGDKSRAIARYNEFLASDPDSPYADQIREKVRVLEEEMSQVPEAPPAEGETQPPPPPEEKAPVPADAASLAEVRSLVLVESEPAGAPLSIYERLVATAAPFRPDGDNSGWRQIVTGERTPKDLSLKVGHYHVVIEPFQDYKRSETDINLSPGHVYTFKANLSQGEFMGFLRVKSNVEGAKVYLDDPPPHKTAPWTRTPKGGLVNQGEHEIWVEAPGYKPYHTKVTTPHGATVEVEARLARVPYGYLVISGNAAEIDIEVDDKEYPLYSSRRDPVKIRLPAGKHKVVLDADGRKEFEGEVEVPAGQVQPLRAKLMDAYPRDKAVVLAIVSAGALVGGVLMHVEAQKTTKHNPDILDVFEYGRWGMFGLSGVCAGLAIFFAVYDPYDDSLVKLDKARDFVEGEGEEGEGASKTVQSGRVYVAPLFGPEGGGLGVAVSF
jgi:hypothetical protein